MKINNIGSDVVRSTYSQGVRGASEQGSKPAAPAQPVTPAGKSGDQVQISDAGRALAARANESLDARGELTAERVGEIRQRILEGAYNSMEVVDEVARRMLERGDI